MVKCTVCGNEIEENDEFCKNCGTKVDKSAAGQNVDNQQVPAETTKFCSNCGEKIDINAEICPKCGVRVAGATGEKNPFLALILSFLIVGLGQFYNGHSTKGVILLISAIISGILILFVIGLLLWPIVWIYAMYDAYKSAELINNGVEVPDKITLSY